MLRPALLRVLALLVGVTTVGFVYEFSQAREMEEAAGEVVDVRPGGRQGPEYAIRFEHQDRPHRFSSSLGIVETLGRFRDLEVGDSVPVAYDPSAPGEARLATFSSLYLFTACMATLTALFLAVILYRVVTGREG